MTSSSSLLSLALVDYQGKAITPNDHGNAKTNAAPYVRTHPTVQQNIRKDLQNKKRPRDIYSSMIQIDDIHQAPKRLKQIHNIKYRMKEEEKDGEEEKRRPEIVHLDHSRETAEEA